jgi:hypothetical protein
MPGDLHLGGGADDRFILPSRSLTTHGVIVGMTGSGKTGLGVVLLEELLAADIPCLILDPKGDMGNLLLNFPDFRPADFEPWVDAGEAERKGLSVSELAAASAGKWQKGLAGAGIDSGRMRQVRDGADIRILTPGSTAGIPLDLVGDMSAPDASWSEDGELLRDEIEGLVSGILVLAGLDVDPLTSREHILLANLVEHAWREGRDLDLPTLIGWVHAPPIRKLGVFDLDTFFPSKDRLALAMRLNGLVASPSFAEWMKGEPLDIPSLLRAPDGRPRASILYLSHLSDRERLFVVARVLAKLVTWMRTQPGTSELRALLYADEVAGFAPPTAEPPTKRAILTLYKQARAHGLGVVLSTQNPVDLDYKIMSNAGTWMVGRLQTERDKARILEGLRSASGDVDVKSWDARIGQLAKREFLVRRTGTSQPETFSTRWAMSFLRGPFARAELIRLRGEMGGAHDADGGGAEEGGGAPVATASTVGSAPSVTASPPQSAPPAASPAAATGARVLGDDETPIPPEVAGGVPVSFLDPAAPWRAKLPLGTGVRGLVPGLAVRIDLLFDDRRGDLRHEESWEAVLFPLVDPVDPREAFIVDYDPRDFRDEIPDGATWRITDTDLSKKSGIEGAANALRDFLAANRTLDLFHAPDLKLYSRPGESRADFEARCMEAAEDTADEAAAKLRDRYESRLDTAQRRLREQERRIEELELKAQAQRQDELLSGAGEVLSMFLGGRRRTRSLSGLSRRRSRSRASSVKVENAAEKADDQRDAIAELEAELRDELAELWEEWEAKARAIEPFRVGLEKNDVRVGDLRVFFAPGRA